MKGVSPATAFDGADGYELGRRTVVLLLAGGLISGCSKALDRPSFDANWSAKKAFELFDADADEQIDLSEAEAAPGLLAAFGHIDSSGDNVVSPDEFAQHIEGYRTAASSVVNGSFIFTHKKRPLTAAQITFEPEPFMGRGFEPVTGTTDSYGSVVLSRPNVEEGGYPGVYLGLYRVKVSKQVDGKETLPAEYNTATTLGFDTGQKNWSRTGPQFDL